MKKETFYCFLVFILTTFCSNAQRVNETNELAYHQTKISRKSNDLLSLYQNKKTEDSLMIFDKYESYHRTSIILESIGGSLVSYYALSSLRNGTSTNNGFLYSGLGVSLIGLILNIKANKMSDQFVGLYDASKAQRVNIALLVRNDNSFNEVGLAIRF
jgi:hypothetical protein